MNWLKTSGGFIAGVAENSELCAGCFIVFGGIEMHGFST